MNLNFDQILDLTESADIVTVDTEGSERLLGISICFDGLSNGFYFPIGHEDEDNLNESQIKRLYSILGSRYALVFHNAIYDLRVLRDNGFDYLGLFYDTMLMAHWIDEEQYNFSLDTTSKIYGGKPKNMSPVMQFIIDTEGWDKVPYYLMYVYSSNDAFITHQLFRELLPLFQAEGFDKAINGLWEMEQKFIRVMGPMIELGIKVDTAFCVREYMKGIGIMDECKKELGFNPDSGIALKKFLIDELGLPVIKLTPTGKVCFDKDTMEKYDELLENTEDTRAQTILRYRGWRKTVSSNYKPYMDFVDGHSILHPGYKLHGTKTGRLSCEKPALHQIPKSSIKEWNGGLKQAFVPRHGFKLWTIDFSQLQFRMACVYAEQYELLEIFNDPTRDIFNEMAKKISWLRDDVKTLTYLIIFGGGANQASIAFSVPLSQGGELINEFHSAYPEIKQIAKDCEKVARKQNYIQYWTGRRRHFPKGSKFYRAFNAAIQGGEAEIMKRAMIRLSEEVCDNDCRMLLQIHDEIAFEITEGMESDKLLKATKVMEEAGKDFCKFVGVDVKFACSAKPWGEK